MLKILFIGDVVGKIGRRMVEKALPEMKKRIKPDLVIANAENAAHGSGITLAAIKDLAAAGVDYFTLGDHAFDKLKQFKEANDNFSSIVRPANFPPGLPGDGFKEIETRKGKVLLINLIGRVFMSMDYDCPFRKLDEILANNDLPKKKYSAIIVDIHAEATSEKVALSHYAADRISAMAGTHTHIQTNDCEVKASGQAYITDIGMTGAKDECIGVNKEGIIRTFLTQVKETHSLLENGQAILNAVLITINPKTARAEKIIAVNVQGEII